MNEAKWHYMLLGALIGLMIGNFIADVWHDVRWERRISAIEDRLEVMVK